MFFMGVFHHQLKVAMPKKKAGASSGFNLQPVSKRLPKMLQPPKTKRKAPGAGEVAESPRELILLWGECCHNGCTAE